MTQFQSLPAEQFSMKGFLFLFKNYDLWLKLVSYLL